MQKWWLRNAVHFVVLSGMWPSLNHGQCSMTHPVNVSLSRDNGSVLFTKQVEPGRMLNRTKRSGACTAVICTWTGGSMFVTPRNLQAHLRDPLVTVFPFCCFMGDLSLMTTWSSSWNLYFHSKSFKWLEWHLYVSSVYGATCQTDHTNYFPYPFNGFELECCRVRPLWCL